MARRTVPPGPNSSLSLRAALEAAKAKGEPSDAIAADLARAVEQECRTRLETGPMGRMIREARRAYAHRVNPAG